jgi:hypothetical protein
MRLKIIVVAEDHQNGVKSTRDGTIEIPGNMLAEARDANDRVRQLAEWGLKQAGGYLADAFNGGAPQAQPANPLYLPNSPAPQQAYGGYQPGQGSPPPYMGDHAPARGTHAPYDPRRTPGSAEQAVRLSTDGLMRAVTEDKRRGANFVVGQQNNPVRVNLDIGWGPHRRK